MKGKNAPLLTAVVKHEEDDPSHDPDNQPDVMLAWEKYHEFEICHYEEKTFNSLSQFIMEWQERMCTALAVGCQYSDSVLAFKLMEKANLNIDEMNTILLAIQSETSSQSLLSDTITRIIRLKSEQSDDNGKKRKGRKRMKIEADSTTMPTMANSPATKSENELFEVAHHIEQESFDVNEIPDDIETDEGTLKDELGIVVGPISEEGVGLLTETTAYVYEDDILFGNGQEAGNMDELAEDDSKLEGQLEESAEGDDNLLPADPNLPEIGIQAPSEIKENQCPVCYKMLSRKYDVPLHLTTHTNVKEFACEDCGVMFVTRNNLLKHKKYNVCQNVLNRQIRKRTLKDGKFACELCPKRFVRREEYDDHIRVHTGDKPFPCTFCPERFHSSKELFRHFKRHPEYVYYTCKECKRDYKNYEQYRQHRIRAHDGTDINVDGDFFCNRCPKRFTNNRAYEAHLKEHGVEKYQCQECERSFPTKKQLKQHSFDHSGKKAFDCPNCDKHFNSSVRLRIHMRTHRNNLTFLCFDCGKSFPDKKQLRQHLPLHRGKKMFECAECRKSFINSSNYKAHLRTHSGERPFECQECGRRFAIKKTLMVHSRVHTKEKPYHCEDCGRAFSHDSVMKKHRRLHTGGAKPYVCAPCGADFSMRQQLLNHLKKCEEAMPAATTTVIVATADAMAEEKTNVTLKLDH